MMEGGGPSVGQYQGAVDVDLCWINRRIGDELGGIRGDMVSW